MVEAVATDNQTKTESNHAEWEKEDVEHTNTIETRNLLKIIISNILGPQWKKLQLIYVASSVATATASTSMRCPYFNRFQYPPFVTVLAKATAHITQKKILNARISLPSPHPLLC